MNVELTVQPLTARLDGYGIVAMSQETMNRLDVETGDFVSFDHGSEQATAAVQPARGVDGTEFVALDPTLRDELELSEGDDVTVTALSVDAAHSVVVSLVDHCRTEVDIEELRTRLTHRILSTGATLSVPLSGVNGATATVRVESVTPSRTVGTKGYTDISVEGVGDSKKESRAGTSRSQEESSEVGYSDIGGMHDVIEKVREVVELPLAEPEAFDRFGVEAPAGVLLHGPPGTGKTLLARSVANEVDAHFTSISAGEVFTKWFGESESNLREKFEHARKNAPAIIYIDEIDAIAGDRGKDDGPESRVVNELLTQMDGLDVDEDVVVMASTNRLDDLDPAVRRSGRFDREIEVSQPEESGRQEILAIHARGVPLADDVELDKYAETTHGYTGADLERVVQEGVMAAIRHARGISDSDGVATEDFIDTGVLQQTTVRDEDLENGLAEVEPSGMRSYQVQVPDVTWDDVGGLEEEIQTLREVVEWPRKHPDLYDEVSLDPATGILLHGPPGTGKTLLAKALAAEADASFLPVEGPELLDSQTGSTENAIRELFETARAHAPSVVYLDEVDALTAARDGQGAGSRHGRIVAQLLAELDGLADNTGVTVVAATNQPERMDEAILRAGRFDEVLEIGLPDREARRAVLIIHTEGRPLTTEVNLNTLADETEGHSAAALAALCRRASQIGIRRAVEQTDDSVTLCRGDFREALRNMAQQRDGINDAKGTEMLDEPGHHGFA